MRSELLAARLAIGFRTPLSSLPLLIRVDQPHGLCDSQSFVLFGRLAFASVRHRAEHDLFRSDVGGSRRRLDMVEHGRPRVRARIHPRPHLERVMVKCVALKPIHGECGWWARRQPTVQPYTCRTPDQYAPGEHCAAARTGKPAHARVRGLDVVQSRQNVVSLGDLVATPIRTVRPRESTKWTKLNARRTSYRPTSRLVPAGRDRGRPDGSNRVGGGLPLTEGICRTDTRALPSSCRV